MSEGIFLVDVDGVLISKPKMWDAIGEVFIRLYPNRSKAEIRSFYNQHRGEKPNVDNVIEAGFAVYGPEFWKPFYEIDFKSLVNPGWEELKFASIKKGLHPRVFSEGSVGRRSWMPSHVINGYQPYKVEQMKLGVPAIVLEDKLAELPARVARWRQEGTSRIVGLDDWDEAVETMEKLGIEAYKFDEKRGKSELEGRGGNCECPKFFTRESLAKHNHQVESLFQMSEMFLAD